METNDLIIEIDSGVSEDLRKWLNNPEGRYFQIGKLTPDGIIKIVFEAPSHLSGSVVK